MRIVFHTRSLIFWHGSWKLVIKKKQFLSMLSGNPRIYPAIEKLVSFKIGSWEPLIAYLAVVMAHMHSFHKVVRL